MMHMPPMARVFSSSQGVSKGGLLTIGFDFSDTHFINSSANMSGKTTYLRQLALLTVMALVGSL